MKNDLTKFFLFIALSLAVLILVTDQRRPLASAPLAGDNPVGESETSQSDITRGAGFAGIPNANPPPLSLMMPTTGEQGA